MLRSSNSKVSRVCAYFNMIFHALFCHNIFLTIVTGDSRASMLPMADNWRESKFHYYYIWNNLSLANLWPSGRHKKLDNRSYRQLFQHLLLWSFSLHQCLDFSQHWICLISGFLLVICHNQFVLHYWTILFLRFQYVPCMSRTSMSAQNMVFKATVITFVTTETFLHMNQCKMYF